MTGTTGLASTAAHGARLTLIAQWTKLALQVISMTVLARLLSPHEFGLYAAAFVFVGLGQLVADFGFSSATMQAKQISRVQQSNLFWINAAVGVVLGIALVSSRHLVSDFYHQPALAPVVIGVAFVFVVQALTTQFTAASARDLRFSLLAIADVTGQVVGVALAIVVAALGGGVWSLVAQQLAVSATIFGTLAVGGDFWPTRPSRAPMVQFLTFGANTFGVQFLNYLSANVDSIVIGRVLGTTPLGLYDKGYQLLKMPVQQIASPLTRVALPMLSRVQDQEDRFVRAVGLLQLGLLYFVGGAFAISAGVAQSLIPFAFGPGWNSAATVFQVLAIGGLFQTLGYIYYWVFLARGRTGTQLKYSIVTRLIMVTLIVISAMHGIVAVAWAVTASLFINWAVLTFGPIRQVMSGVRQLLLSAVRPLLLHLAVFAGLALLCARADFGDAGEVFLGVAIGLLVYCCAVRFVSGYKEDGRKLVRVIKVGRSL